VGSKKENRVKKLEKRFFLGNKNKIIRAFVANKNK